jgi:hypothetical protein
MFLAIIYPSTLTFHTGAVAALGPTSRGPSA